MHVKFHALGFEVLTPDRPIGEADDKRSVPCQCQAPRLLMAIDVLGPGLKNSAMGLVEAGELARGKEQG